MLNAGSSFFKISGFAGVLLLASGCGSSLIDFSINHGANATPTPALINLSWSAADGGQLTGLNSNTLKNGKLVRAANLNGVVYATWREADATSNEKVRVVKYNGGSSWSFIDGGAGALSVTQSDYSGAPELLAANNKLYIAFQEYMTPYKVIVKYYDGTSWYSMTTSSGLAYAGGAYNPTLAVIGTDVYVSFYEASGAGSTGRFHVMKYAGGTTWNLIDTSSGGSADGLTYGAGTSLGGSLGTDGTSLYATWTEQSSISGTPYYQVRVAQYSGSAWTLIDGNALAGLNITAAKDASGPGLVYFNNKMILTWSENNFVRSKSYDGTTWTRTETNGLNYTTSATAIDVSGVADTAIVGNLLYKTWIEYSSANGGVGEVRVASYDGNAWSIVDGNSSYGLNVTSTNSAGYEPTLVNYGSGLMSMWTEQASSVWQVHAKIGQ